MVEDIQSSEELAFVGEEVDRTVIQSIEYHLKEQSYDEKKISFWMDAICDSSMKGLTELRKPFKYIVTCLIVQKNGAGVHSAISSYWDTVTDAIHVVKWPSDKHKDHNRTMYCIVTIGALGF